MARAALHSPAASASAQDCGKEGGQEDAGRAHGLAALDITRQNRRRLGLLEHQATLVCLYLIGAQAVGLASTAHEASQRKGSATKCSSSID